MELVGSSLHPAMSSSTAQLLGVSSRSQSAPAGPVPLSTRKRTCRPGYKSRAKIARSREKAKQFKIILALRQENFNLTAEVGKLKSYSRINEKCHQEEAALRQNNFTKQNNLIIGKYHQISELYSNLQENFLKSEKRNAHLQEQLDVMLEENGSLLRKVSTLERFHPVNQYSNDPLDLRLRALEDYYRPVPPQLDPVNPVSNDPLDLRLSALEEQYRTVPSPSDLRLRHLETHPPEVVYDLVKL